MRLAPSSGSVDFEGFLLRRSAQTCKRGCRRQFGPEGLLPTRMWVSATNLGLLFEASRSTPFPGCRWSPATRRTAMSSPPFLQMCGTVVPWPPWRFRVPTARAARPCGSWPLRLPALSMLLSAARLLSSVVTRLTLKRIPPRSRGGPRGVCCGGVPRWSAEPPASRIGASLHLNSLGTSTVYGTGAISPFGSLDWRGVGMPPSGVRHADCAPASRQRQRSVGLRLALKADSLRSVATRRWRRLVLSYFEGRVDASARRCALPTFVCHAYRGSAESARSPQSHHLHPSGPSMAACNTCVAGSRPPQAKLRRIESAYKVVRNAASLC